MFATRGPKCGPAVISGTYAGTSDTRCAGTNDTGYAGTGDRSTTCSTPFPGAVLQTLAKNQLSLIVKQLEMDDTGLDGPVGFSSKQPLSPMVFRRCTPNGTMPEGLAGY